MSNRSAADIAIHECEAKIQTLLAAALTARQYEDVAYLASIASALAKLASAQGASPAAPMPLLAKQSELRVDPPTPLELMASAKTPERSITPRANGNARSSDYPIFERQADRLIKIGWSKRDRSAYEHRVLRGVVRSVAQAFSTALTTRQSLRMDEVLPVEDGTGTEIPSYQAYLVLAWLRQLGAIERQGNDGYAFAQGRMNLDDVDDLWTRTPERKHG